tara:strand:- start:153 stop:416 length:264 start_codon:yes stop_codon:yes gene_type:complete
MKLLGRDLIDLSDKNNPDRLGHVSVYKLKNNNTYKVFYIEARYFGMNEVDSNNNTVNSDRSLDDYDYKIDIYFGDKARSLGWPKWLR